MEADGQSADPEVRVVVYAKKGDNLIQLSKLLADNNLYEQHSKNCDYSKFNDNATSVANCYDKEITSDPALELLSRNTANSLITLFALQ